MNFDYKNATSIELRDEYNRISKEIGDDQFFTKKELKHLPKILSDGEQVLAFSSGVMDGNTWLITLTDRRIIFLDKGILWGLKQSAIDLDKVNAVSGETGLFFGTILIEDGASQRKITNVWKKTVVKFTNKVRDAIEARKNLHIHRSSSEPTDDFIAKLERLASLKDKGVINQQEFDEQKTKILDIN